MKKDKTCFVISPIGEEKSDVRKHADAFLKAMYSLTVESAYSNLAAINRSLIGWQLSSIHRPSLMLKNQPIDGFNV